MKTNNRTEQMNVVIVGHVDHGKSTIIGRLLADTGSLPEGKLEQVKNTCERNAKPFEFAFLLDALKEEQAQGITIDTARCFFKTEKRRYTIIDAPGHIEFLKNMITGAARADAAFIVIDASEGIQENSTRHAYMISMLGIKQICVLVNKMDLVGYKKDLFESICRDYGAFLDRLNLHAATFIPVSGAEGINIKEPSLKTSWYKGPHLLEQFDLFEKKDLLKLNLPFRFPVQDIYKFTEEQDNRRILAGTIETGNVHAGEEVTFLPSGKTSEILSIESFNTPPMHEASAGQAIGFTLKTQIYISTGEMMVKTNDPQPYVSKRFRANLFWMGTAPMIKNKKYKLKTGSARHSIQVVNILNVLDASDLSSEKNKQQIDRHDIAECIIECNKPAAFDIANDILFTARFVVIDNYEIAGAGIILEKIQDNDSVVKDHVEARELSWVGGNVKPIERQSRYGHGSKFVVITSPTGSHNDSIAETLERHLFNEKFNAYYLRMDNVIKGLDSDITGVTHENDEHIRRLGELARILTDSGLIFITSLPDVDEYDIRTLEMLNQPNEILVVNIGEGRFKDYKAALDLKMDCDIKEAVHRIYALLKELKVILEYQI